MSELGPLTELSDTECRELLSFGSHVGHIGFSKDGKQFVIPVNYLFENNAVYIRTHEGSLITTLHDVSVAFEVDEHRALENSGWSVMVHGTVQKVSDPQIQQRVERGTLRSWAWHHPDAVMLISVDEISGRRIGELER